jgi:hypothetical protein
MTRRSNQATQTAESTQDVQEVQEGQTTPQPQESGESVETPQIDPEVLKAYLESQGLEIRRRGERKPRQIRMTSKQAAFVRALQEVPEGEPQDVAALALSAGATATSHGFVFRMLEHGYLELRVTEHGLKSLPDAHTEESEAAEEEPSES